MTARIIDGKDMAARLVQRVAKAAADLTTTLGRPLGLAVVLVGDDPASGVYVRNKARQTVAAGMRSVEHRLAVDASPGELLDLVKALNADDTVDGILVQLPLPPRHYPQQVIAAIDPAKDVDGFHPLNAGYLASGLPGLVPCTPLGCLSLARSIHPTVAGLDVVVVGRSNIVGKPVAQLFLRENATVTIAHSRTRDLPETCRRADILIAAVGRPELVRGDWIRPEATVIDVGINRVTGAGGVAVLKGDVAFDEAMEVAGAITPVPGGVGPMTIAFLLSNTVHAAAMRHGIEVPADLGA